MLVEYILLLKALALKQLVIFLMLKVMEQQLETPHTLKALDKH